MKQHDFFKGILLCLCLLTGINTFAYDAQIDGIYYNFSGDKAEVTSNGSNSYSGSVVIPTSVSFGNNSYSVTDIGNEAFYDCSGLISITIPNSITRIGNKAFSGCSSLASVHITDLSAWCRIIFQTYYTYDERSNADYSYYSYHHSNPLSYAHHLYLNGEEIKDLVIPNDVTSISGGAFDGCNALTSVTIPNSVTSIGGGAFYGCSRLSSVHITDLSAWCEIIFQSFLISETIDHTDGPNKVYPSYNYSSNPLSYAHKLYLNGVEITDLFIPAEVTSLDYAFYGCSGLKSVTIPSSMTSIGDLAFYGCSSLTSVIVDIVTPLTIANFTFTNRANATLIVPAGCKEAYETAEYWEDFKKIVEKTEITIGSTGYATYCYEHDLDFSEVSGMKAYIASGFSPSKSSLLLTRVTEVPAGEGLYIVGEEGTYHIPFTETDMIYSNLLIGVTTATTISPTDGSYTNFILANGVHGVAFYSLSEAGELAAGKAYLQLPTASVPEVKAIRVIFDDDEDAIQSIVEESQTERIYNLQGQQVNAPKNGLYIINGKKLFIK